MGEEVEHASSVLSAIFTPIRDALPSMVIAIIIAIIGYALIKYLLRLVTHGLSRSSMDNIAAGFVRSVVRIILYVVLAVIVLSILNVPMDSIVAVIASAGVAVGLALKDSLSNLAGGFILLFSKPVKQGDTVQIDDVIGKVELIDILYTKIVTPDNTVAFIPNGKVTTAKIINYTEKENRRVDLALGIAYESDLDLARETLLSVVKQHSLVLQEPEAEVLVNNHGTDAVELLLRVWCKSADYWTVYYDLMEQTKQALDQNHVEIPYHKVEVHLPQQ
jgi:small conductance mechanosensitive channel